jgi:hypothetical protein
VPSRLLGVLLGTFQRIAEWVSIWYSKSAGNLFSMHPFGIIDVLMSKFKNISE